MSVVVDVGHFEQRARVLKAAKVNLDEQTLEFELVARRRLTNELTEGWEVVVDR
jgi:hypothetical protein